ncbi:YbaB/EbfC family nucleoid-associated protein [Nocardiopsis composta]
MARELERLRETQRSLAEASANLESATAEAVSRDRTVSAKVNAKGEITELKFHTSKYRTMAPAELSAAVLDVIGRARAEMEQQVADAFGSLAPGTPESRAEVIRGGDPSAFLADLGLDEPPGHPRT